VLLAGNRHATEVNTPRSDASLGLLLKGDGKGGLRPAPYSHSGFYAPYEARALALLHTHKGKALIVANNDHLPQLFSVQQQLKPGNLVAKKK
jgi:enediyne biosynthesis protein E4